MSARARALAEQVNVAAIEIANAAEPQDPGVARLASCVGLLAAAVDELAKEVEAVIERL